MAAGELNRRSSSRQPLVHIDDTTSLTSFPDPSDCTHPPEETQTAGQPLTALLDQNGPSIFDEGQSIDATDPQSLSAAPAATLQQIIDHNGAIEMVRRLSKALAQRDAHITALRRLAEDYKVPTDLITAASTRAKRSEDRRLSLAQAADTPRETNGVHSDGGSSPSVSSRKDSSSVSKEITKLFGGKGKVKQLPDASRSASLPRRPVERQQRPQSIDAQSLQSVKSNESTSWTAGLFGSSASRRHDSPAERAPVEMTTRHDKEQLPPTLSDQSIDPQEAAWNRYLRRLEELRQQNKQELSGGEVIGASHFGQEGKDGQKKLDALKMLIVGGIPMRLRHSVWMELSDTRAIVVPDEYTSYLDRRSDVEEIEADDILKDVSRTLTSLNSFFADKGFERLKDVLIAFVGKYRDLGYTQGLNTIAGCLLLAIASEEDAFWMLCNIVEKFFPRHYFSRADNMILPLADSTMLERYIQQLLPRLWDHLKEVGFAETHPIFVKWFFTAFSNTLPPHVLMRVWDVWLCMPNQKHFLFSFALALLSHNADGLLQCEDSGDFLAYLDGDLDIPEDDDLTEMLKEAVRLNKKLGDVDARREEHAANLRLENKLQRRKTGSMEALVDREDAQVSAEAR